MEKIYGLVDLNENELREHNGGSFPMLLIRVFVPTMEGIIGFINGFKQAYDQTTQD